MPRTIKAFVEEFNASPIIPLNTRAPKSDRNFRINETDGLPYCLAGLKLHFRGNSKTKGKQYACPARAKNIACPLPDVCGLKVAWIKEGRDYRQFGYRILRGSEEFKELYHKRSSAERVFSRLKETRRLEKHFFRGYKTIRVHSTLSVITMMASALAKIRTDDIGNIRECVRQIG